MTRRAVFHESGVFDDGVGTIGSFPGAGAVSSVFGRTGAVIAVTGDYYGAVAAALTGATQASRYVGATASGAPVSGTFVKGDWVVAQDGHIFVCTTGGTPGTWVDIGGSGGVPTSRSLTAGAALTGGGDLSADRTFDVAVDGSTIEVSSDALRVKADGITANEIAAGAVGASELASTAVTPTTYGDATHVGQFTVDADGRITGASAVAITGTGTGAGLLELVYRYTITGSDKASIDTGADTADAGSNDWTNGDLLEIWFQGRTDQTAVRSAVVITFNNDGTGIYDLVFTEDLNTTLAGGTSRGTAGFTALAVAGASAGTGEAGIVTIAIPDYAGTVLNKVGTATGAVPSATAATNLIDTCAVAYRSTSALSRFKIACTSTFKFKVGSQLLIYKRKAS